jgi:hypothetical protein
MNAPEEFDLDLGDGHSMRYFCWSPDRSIPSTAERYKGVPDIPKAGVTVKHLTPDGKPCMGAVNFDVPGAKEIFGGERHVWQVQSWDPLTISPSLLCSCGDHGFIHGGKWVRA